MPTSDELGLELRDYLGKIVFTRFAALGDHPRDLMELGRLQVVERQVLKLPLDARYPQPVRERSVDLHRLARLLVAALLGQRRERPHVVQPVRELDEDDPDVLGHRDEHLAQIVGLGLGKRFELDLAELGHPVDKVGDLVAEALADLVERNLGVLHDVVKQRGLQRRGVHVQLGEDESDLDGVVDERLAALAALALVRKPSEVEGLVEAGEVSVRVVGLDLRLYLFEGCRQSRSFSPRSGFRCLVYRCRQYRPVEPGKKVV